jgi:hypothetical protein
MKSRFSMTQTKISETELAHRTREIVNRVQHGELAVVESSGKEQIVLLDALDFRLLRALASCAMRNPEDADSPDTKALRDYLDDEISLGKTAELLQLSRFELTERFERLGVPTRLGPASLEEARAEIAAALRHE